MKFKFILPLLVGASLFSNVANSADFCRVVTVEDWTVTNAEGVHKESLSDHPVYIFATVNGRLFNQEVNPSDRTMLMSVTYIGKMNTPDMVNVVDSSNSNTFAFEPMTKIFYEVDVFIPDETQREQFHLKSSAQTIRGHYKGCTLEQVIKMQDNYVAYVKQFPYMVQE